MAKEEGRNLLGGGCAAKLHFGCNCGGLGRGQALGNIDGFFDDARGILMMMVMLVMMMMGMTMMMM